MKLTENGEVTTTTTKNIKFLFTNPRGTETQKGRMTEPLYKEPQRDRGGASGMKRDALKALKNKG